MDALMLSLSYWFFLKEFWIIIGIIFIILEVLDGSLIFFLPIGFGSFLNAIILFLKENYIDITNIQVNSDVDEVTYMNSYLGFLDNIDTWYHLLMSLAIFSILSSIAIKLFSKNDLKKDVNDY